MEIQFEMIVAHTYTVDDVYWVAFKIEGLKLWASNRPSWQIGSTFYNQTTNKPLNTTNFQTSNHVNGEGSNQQALNVPNTNANNVVKSKRWRQSDKTLFSLRQKAKNKAIAWL